MARKISTGSDEVKDFSVLPEDIKTYRAEMGKYQTRREGNVLIPFFEDYMERIGAARISKNGMTIVKDPALFSKWVAVRDSVESYDAFKNEELRRLFPTEMDAFRKRFAKLRETMVSIGIAKKQ